MIFRSLYIVLILSFQFISCKLTQVETLVVNNEINESTTFNEVVPKELTLAREVCNSGSLSSFCDDGYEQLYRSNPILVNPSKVIGQINEYDTIYMFAVGSIADSLVLKDIKFDSASELANLFKPNSISFDLMQIRVSNSYKRRINKYQKKLKSKKHFNGYFNYSVHWIKFKCVFGGQTNIILPNIIQEENNGVHTSFVYYITEIDSVYNLRNYDFKNL